MGAARMQRDYPFRVVAADVGGTKIAVGTVVYTDASAAPVIENPVKVATDAARGGEAVFETLAATIERVLASCATPPIGIAVGTAGCVDIHDGSIATASDIMPGWAGIAVRERLAARFGLPTAVLGDVQAHALGEARWGVARSCLSALMVAPGTGLGGAIIIDGKVVKGAHGSAGHIGDTLSHRAVGVASANGVEGHIEPLVCGSGIEARYRERIGDARTSATGADISRMAAQGDADAAAVIRAAGLALGEGIGAWVNMFDPELVIVTGSVTGAGSIWRDALAEGFAAHVLEPLRDTPIVDGALGESAALIGAAENLLDTVDD